MPGREPIGFVRLAKAISWAGVIPGTKHYEMYRGTIYPMYTEHEYNWLIKNGICIDPHKKLNEMSPQDLHSVRPGTEITLIRDIGIGDVLIVTTLLEPLKELYPNLRFSFATNSNHLPIFDGAPCIARTYQISKMRGAFNVIDLRGFAERHPDKRRFERIDIYARFLIGKTLADYSFPVPILTELEILEAESFLSGLPGPIAIVVAKSATTHTRTIPEPQLFSIINHLMGNGLSVVIVHSHLLPNWPCTRNLTGKLDIRQLAAVTAVADVVVTPDTGLVHIAEAVHTPHVDLFSAWPPNLRLTYYKHSFPIFKGDLLECCPCYSARGPCPHLTCFKLITNEEIYEKTQEALAIKVASS